MIITQNLRTQITVKPQNHKTKSQIFELQKKTQQKHKFKKSEPNQSNQK